MPVLMKHPHDNSKDGRKYKGLRPIGDSVAHAAKRIGGKKGVQFGQMLINWRQIAGETISQKTVPIKLSFPHDHKGKATLHVSVRSADALHIQQNIEQLVDRVNRYFGYQAIDKVKLVHMPPPLPHMKHKKRPGMVHLSSDQKTTLDHQLSNLEDENLREALRGFGEGLIRKKQQNDHS